MKHYQKIMELKNTLSKYKSYSWFKKLNLAEENIHLFELEEEIRNYKPKIAVIGEFSTGKSSLINSFLGVDILPAKFNPTTKYITEIKYSNDNFIYVDGKRLPLSKENIESLVDIKSDKIEVFMNNEILKNYTLVDTPGTNDPSKFSDDIVFKLIGESDLVIFVMNINQALKETEKQFISQLIRKKDIEKFFFVLNFSDMVSNLRLVKNEVVDKLCSLLDLDKKIIKTHTFVYSAIQALSHKEDNPAYKLFIQAVNDFVDSNKEKLLNLWIDSEIASILKSILLKIETIEDKIANNIGRYEEELKRVEEEIEKFEIAINKELVNLKRDFNLIKNNFKNRVKDSIKTVYSEILSEVDNMEYSQLVGTRYIELRTKKLVEDLIEQDTKLFMKELAKLIQEFDKKVLELDILNTINFMLPTIKKTTAGRKAVNIAAVAAGGTAIFSMLSQIEAGLGISSALAGFGGIAPFLSGIPFIGPILAGIGTISQIALPVMGTFLVAAGTVLFNVAKWGVGKIGDIAQNLEEKAKKRVFLNNLKNSLKQVENKVMVEIDKITLDKFKENYIKSKFPQKALIEEKIKILRNEYFKVQKLTQNEIASLEQFKSELALLIPLEE